MRLLFFLERELHLPVLAPLMHEAHRRGLGEIGIYSVSYVASTEGVPGRGLRQSVVEQMVNVPFQLVSDPHQWRPDITFMADFSYQFVEGLGKLVNVGHGTIGKGWFFSRQLISRRENCADLLCVPGEIHAEALSDQVFIPIAVTGMPKLDAVFRGDYNREDILRRHGLDPGNKTALFAPTFNSELSIVPHIGHDLRRYIPDYLNIFIKLHGAAPEDQKRAYRAFAESHPNVACSEEMDIGPAFAACDVLLTDVSSVIYEFLALGKPVVLFDSPTMANYAGYDENDLEHRYRDAGCRFSDMQRLPDCLSRSLLSPISEPLRQLGRRFVSKQDGNSAGLVLDAALELHEQPRASIIIRDSGGENLPRLLSLWSDRYQLLVSSPQQDRADGAVWLQPTDSAFEILQKAMPHVNTDKIIYFDSAWLPSPLLPDFLLMHLRFDETAGIVYPLRQGSDYNGIQSLGLHVRFQQNVSPDVMGWQLTYSMTGRAKPVDVLDSPVFALRPEAWCDQLTNPADERLSWLELLRHAHMNGLGPRLALDTCVRPDQATALPQSAQRCQTSHNEPPAGEQKDASEDDESTRLLQAIEDDPSDTNALKRFIRHCFKLGKWDMVDVYAAMLPADAEATLLHARSLMQQDLGDHALVVLEKIDTLSITDGGLLFEILNERGRLLVKTQRLDEARHHLEEALRLRPDATRALVNLGTCLLVCNLPSEAAEHFEDALRHDSAHIDARFGLGLANHAQQRFDEAESCFGRILDLEPSHMKTLNTMLQFAYESRRFASVEQRLQCHLDRNPADDNMRFVLAGVLYEQEKPTQALEAVERVLQSDPDFRGGAELRDRINNKTH
ncbi:MAG: tetratricopeptide repeat protein [Candidatus Cloacimonetes bacterium]|nr:tetratricopeptide repeat protein [Candidatus Cloacimonadota bacterium]